MKPGKCYNHETFGISCWWNPSEGCVRLVSTPLNLSHTILDIKNMPQDYNNSLQIFSNLLFEFTRSTFLGII